MKRLALIVAALLVAIAAARPVAQTAAAAPLRSGKTLDIYVADTEGGKAALFVSPTGQTVLVDSGNPGDRDLNRILAMLADAGVKQIDYMISTHYHVDHIGGLQELSKRVPIAHYIDHGPSVEAKEQVQGFAAAYEQLHAAAKHTAVKPGDRIPVTGLDWRIVTSAGQTLKTPLPGGGRPNPACAEFKKRDDPPSPDDNAASVGSVITYGQFRVLDLGDLLYNVEGQLMCPNNPIGTVDLYMVTHHGLAQSNSEVLVHGVRPRVALMQNGTRKGGAPAVFQVLQASPGLEDVWQLHWSYAGGIDYNPAGMFIANVDDPATIAGVLTAPPPAGRRGGFGAGAGAPAGARGGGPAPAETPGGAAPPSVAVPPGGAPAGGSPTGGPPAGAPLPGSPAGAQPAGPVPGGQAAAPGQGGPAGGPGGRGFGGPGGRGNQAHTPAYYIKVSAQSDGSFTVTNRRNGFSKTYSKR